jgi:hypothetical protein
VALPAALAWTAMRRAQAPRAPVGAGGAPQSSLMVRSTAVPAAAGVPPDGF